MATIDPSAVINPLTNIVTGASSTVSNPYYGAGGSGLGNMYPGQLIFPSGTYASPAPVKEDMNVIANVRIEKLENGYLVVYTCDGKEKRRFAADMKEVGEAVIVACTDKALNDPPK